LATSRRPTMVFFRGRGGREPSPSWYTPTPKHIPKDITLTYAINCTWSHLTVFSITWRVICNLTIITSAYGRYYFSLRDADARSQNLQGGHDYQQIITQCAHQETFAYCNQSSPNIFNSVHWSPRPWLVLQQYMTLWSLQSM